MAEPTGEYCIDPADEVAKARELTFDEVNPAEPHYTTEEKLMRPQSEQVEG
jgi:hypothetical protein